MLTATWSGTGGGTGFTRLRFLGNLTTAEVTQQLNAMKTFFGAMTTALPTAVSIAYQALAQEYDDAGVLTKEISGTPPSNTAGSGGTSWAAPVGGVINWETGAFNSHGHRVRGRSYIVPLASVTYDAQGTLASGFLTMIQTAASNLLSGLIPMVVVSKHPDGSFDQIRQVTASVVPDKACILRSRRD